MDNWKLYSWTLRYEHPEGPQEIKSRFDEFIEKVPHVTCQDVYGRDVLYVNGEFVRAEVVSWMSRTLQVRYASENGSSMLGALEDLFEGQPDFSESVYSRDVLLRMI